MFPKDVSEVFLVYILDVLKWETKKFLIQTGRGAWAQVLQEYCGVCVNGTERSSSLICN